MKTKKNDKNNLFAYKEFKKTSIVFTVLFVVAIVLGMVQRNECINVYVPHELREEKEGRTILSLSGAFNQKEVNGYARSTDKGDPCYTIDLPHKIHDGDTLKIVSTSPKVGLNYFWGDEYMQYYGDQTIRAYSKRSLTHPNHPYFDDLSFKELLERYANDGNLLLFSVKGNSFDGFDEEMIEAMHQLGIEKTPADVKKNSSYVAYSNGNDAKVFENQKDPCDVYFNEGDIGIHLVSGGILSGNKSMIEINGVDYSNNRNGMNVVVVDLNSGVVKDSVTYNTNTNDVMMTRNDDAFYTEYVTVIQSQLLKQIVMRGDMANASWHKLFYALAFLIVLLYIDVITAMKATKTKTEVSKWYMIWRCILIMLTMMIAVSCVFGYNYLIENFKDVTVSQLVFHMNTNLQGTNWGDFKDVYINLGKNLGMAIAIGLEIMFYCLKMRKNANGKYFRSRMYASLIVRWAAIVVSIVMVSDIIDDFWWGYDMYGYLVNSHYDADVFKDYYVDPNSVEITFPKEKKNLIYIYMESMEISAADETVGGAKAFNAIPELTQVALENDCFNGHGTKLNGAVALNNCTWTTAGITAQSTGLPLEINHEQSNVRGAVQKFMPGALAIGDILEEQGYANAFLLGSDAKFGNRTQFFEEHGNYEIMDYYWALDTHRIPKGYHVWWGYEDKRLFEFAKEEATRLASGDQPFNLTMLTVDTHFTDGYKCEDCPDCFDRQYSNVYACSSKKVADYVKWVQEQPWGKDTVIVLNGDHLTMDSTYFEDKPVGYERKTYSAIVNSVKEEPSNERYFATVDMFPTTLSAMGIDIKGGRLALGTDLYSGKETLLEEVGRSYLDSQFTMNSKFYNKKILYNGK